MSYTQKGATCAICVYSPDALEEDSPISLIAMEVLRKGLEVADRKAPVAEDLGYVCRDEGFTQEAIDAFSIAIEEGPSCGFIYDERADLLEECDRFDEAKKDRTIAKALWEEYIKRPESGTSWHFLYDPRGYGPLSRRP